MSMKESIIGVIEHIPGQLIVQEYPTKSATTRTLNTHLEKLRQKGIEPDMVIVDYADLLKPTATGFKSQELRHTRNLYEELQNPKLGIFQYGLHPRQIAADWTLR